MPPVRLPSLCTYMGELGYVQAGALGEGPLTYAEITAWAQATARDLPPWMAKALHEASTAFLQGKHDQTPTPPWQEAEATQAQASERVRTLLNKART